MSKETKQIAQVGRASRMAAAATTVLAQEATLAAWSGRSPSAAKGRALAIGHEVLEVRRREFVEAYEDWLAHGHVPA